MRPSSTCIMPPPIDCLTDLAIAASIAFAMLAACSGNSTALTLCEQAGAFDAAEIARSAFFTTREQTKFAPHERHYPLASGPTARYCFSRGCTGQLTVTWTEAEQRRLRELRDEIVEEENAQSELRFIKVATLQLESWLFGRLRRLDQSSVNAIMHKVSKHYGKLPFDDTNWVAHALSTFDRFDKECVTYAMEATQHLLVLANLGLLKHWNVTAPVYRFGIPGHWTAGLEHRATCQRFRFDLNSRASQRHALHKAGKDPAEVGSSSIRQSYLFPGMDEAGMGRPTGPRPTERPDGASALNGPRGPGTR